MDNNATYFDFDVNAFAASSDWHHANGFCDPTGLPTQSALEVPPHNWYLPENTAPRWPSTDSTGTSISGGSPGEWGSPQMMSLPLNAGATHPGQQYNPIDSGMMDTPQITVGIVTAADRKAATKRVRLSIPAPPSHHAHLQTVPTREDQNPSSSSHANQATFSPLLEKTAAEPRRTTHLPPAAAGRVRETRQRAGAGEAEGGDVPGGGRAAYHRARAPAEAFAGRERQ
ncbi:hypothetical protein BP5796_07156 [Coleophoma crateriformis]|uniref:Uncharacterized protein n=1 Tax=Coleophoma crateriformis TaxID=565419 RepID=A0A3D8RIJ6_9HELO|nr:hypothetical protein BP5796_07156 [Coleophoma crateriformis]